MRIFAPSGPTSLASTRRKGAASADGAGGFAAELGSEDGAAVAAPRMTPLGRLDALLGLQELPDPAEKRRRAAKRGRSLLGCLDLIRDGLLSGVLPRTVISSLRQELAASPDIFQDQKLAEILTEIEIRAAVELAKLEITANQEEGP